MAAGERQVDAPLSGFRFRRRAQELGRPALPVLLPLLLVLLAVRRLLPAIQVTDHTQPLFQVLRLQQQGRFAEFGGMLVVCQTAERFGTGSELGEKRSAVEQGTVTGQARDLVRNRADEEVRNLGQRHAVALRFPTHRLAVRHPDR